MKLDGKTFILGIGAQKAGTTWLAQYLTLREDVYMSPLKEMHFFDIKYRPDLIDPKASNFAKRLRRIRRAAKRRKGRGKQKIAVLKERLRFKNDGSAYKAFFKKRVRRFQSHFGEITPGYATIGETGFQEIRELFPQRRLIFIMRDPVERFLSQARMAQEWVVKRKNPDMTQERMIREKLDDPFYAELSRYEKTVRDLDAVFEQQDIVYLFYETLFQAETITALCERLGLPYQPAQVEKVVYGGSKPEPVPDDVKNTLREKFAPTYQFCRERFGDTIPQKWNRAD